jgi:chromosome segregation ATPase
LALPSEVDKLANDKELSEDDIRGSDLFTETWTRMTTSERQFEELQLKLAQTRENWSASRSDAEYATKSLEEHLMKHKKRWAELTDSVETENGHEAVVKSEIVVQAEMIVELDHKLNQALENVRRADVVRASLEEISQLNAALQARLDELMAKNELRSANSATAPVTRPETPSMKDSVDDEKPSAKAEIPSMERLQKEYRRLRKDMTAAIQSKENAKARLEVGLWMFPVGVNVFVI